MLTDTKLRTVKPQEKAFKLADRDGLYVMVLPSGTVSFRYDYRMNGRRETLTLGKYGPAGISLAEAREQCLAAKKKVSQGQSPAAEKQRAKARQSAAQTFGEYAEAWLKGYTMADSTRAMRQSVLERDVLNIWKNRRLEEITAEDLRALTEKIKDRGAPATAVHAREVVMQIFAWAIQRGAKIANPALEVPPSSIATFKPRDRALSPTEIGIFLRLLDQTKTLPTIRLALRLILLTMVRKGELLLAGKEEINWTDSIWKIPAERMKAGRAHNIYLSRQAHDIMMTLVTCAGSSEYLLPGRYDLDKPMSNATLNRVIDEVVAMAQKAGLPLDPFTVHDLRRTGSTLLHEAGYNSDWIEKCLAHEQRGVRAVYNKAEYAEQRREMLQDWADMVDGWAASAQ